ncbi:hypothetical protein ACLKA6_003400 [Drosophila palustris]
MFQCRQLIPLLSLVLSVRGQLNLFGESCEEDDFVDVNFNGCESCEHNYRNMLCGYAWVPCLRFNVGANIIKLI